MKQPLPLCLVFQNKCQLNFLHSWSQVGQWVNEMRNAEFKKTQFLPIKTDSEA